ncbi:hypothetical protein P2318_00235 [Myxococcaceae bacterium GXIMD 01537]
MNDPRDGSQPKCESCHAPLVAGVVVCSYCKALTPFGAELQRKATFSAVEEEEREREEEREQARRFAEERREVALAEAETSARNALKFSVVGLLCCGCIPLSLVGIYQAKRSERLAAEAGVASHFHATLGRLLGWFGVVANVLLLGTGAVGVYRDNVRKEELIAKLETAATQEPLTRQTACELLELYVLQRRGDTSDPLRYGFECDGSVEQSGKQAVLRVSLKRVEGKRSPYTFACLVRDSAWWVRAVRDDARCDEVSAVK